MLNKHVPDYKIKYPFLEVGKFSEGYIEANTVVPTVNAHEMKQISKNIRKTNSLKKLQTERTLKLLESF